MTKNPNKKSVLKAGMYLLETLTAGMYNDPMTMYREYIQNSVDSIDIAGKNKTSGEMRIDIELDPFERSIKFEDNGFGIKAESAEKTFSSIGSSEKSVEDLRGFRGIGRLGGIAFSEKAIFRTKASGEDIESTQEWDCTKLKELLSSPKKTEMTLDDLFTQITKFSQKKSKDPNNSYFQVKLERVKSFRDYLFDIEKVNHYIGQIAPVPFDHNNFSYQDTIDNALKGNLHQYGVYNIYLNGNPIFKPYKDQVKVTKKGFDKIDSVKPIKIEVDGKLIACGWYGIRRELLGSIAKGDYSSGIRVRVGNILIGDAHLLDECFREPRFNSYMIGEIHISTSDLIPNSRRDDFIDNKMKAQFYDAVERTIGIKISKEIRSKSRQSSQNTKNTSINESESKESSNKIEIIEKSIENNKLVRNAEKSGTPTFEKNKATSTFNESLIVNQKVGLKNKIKELICDVDKLCTDSSNYQKIKDKLIDVLSEVNSLK